MKKLLLFLNFILLFVTASWNLQAVVKLNPPLFGGEVLAAQFSPLTNSTRIVYTATPNNLATRLFSLDYLLGPSSVIELSGLMGMNGNVLGFQVSPNENRVVFRGDKDADLVFEIYSVPLTGGATVKLNGPLPVGGDVQAAFQISRDSSRVVYMADQDTNDVVEFYSVPIAGGIITKLNSALVADGDVSGFAISRDSIQVVYSADQDTNNVDELYSVPIDGGAVVKLNGPLVAGGQVSSFRISFDSMRVAYIADQDTNGVLELYSVSIGGGPTIKLNTPLVTNGGIFRLQISPDNSRVVYFADQDTNGVNEIYSAQLTVPASSIKLNTPIVAGGNIIMNSIRISPDSSRIIYMADQDTLNVIELYSAQLTVPGSSIKLNAPLIGPIFGAPKITPDSSRVVYNAEQDIGGVSELYNVPIGGGPITKLNAPLMPGDNVSSDFEISPDSTQVIYLGDLDTNNTTKLYRSQINATGSTQISEDILVPSFEFHPSGDPILYIGINTQGIDELYITLDPPIITSATNVTTLIGTNFAYTITATNGPMLGFGATNLPNWATLNSNVISGVPNVLGTNFITLTATNSDGVGAVVLRLLVNPTNLPPAITSALNVTSTVGANFNYTITADNGPITGFGASGLPSWATLNNDTISGMPDAVGMFAINLFATNSIGFDNKVLNLTINFLNNTNQPPSTNSSTGFNGDFNGDGTLDLLAQKKTKVSLLTANGADTGKSLSLNKKDKVVGANIINSNNALIVQNKTEVKAVLVDSNFANTGTVTLGSLASAQIKVKATGDVNGDGIADIITQQGTTIRALLSPSYEAVTLVHTKSASPKVVGVLTRLGNNNSAQSSLLLAKGKKLFFYDIPTNAPFVPGEANEPQAGRDFDKKYKVVGVITGTNIQTAELIITKGKKVGIVNYGTPTLGSPVFKTNHKLGKISGPK